MNADAKTSGMFTDIRGCGPAGFFLVFLGVAGFVASFTCLTLAVIRSRLAFAAAVGAIVVGSLGLLGGKVAATRNRAIIDTAIQAASLAPADAERLRREGYEGASVCTRMGIQGGMMPLLAGIIAAGISTAHKRRKARIGHKIAN